MLVPAYSSLDSFGQEQLQNILKSLRKRLTLEITCYMPVYPTQLSRIDFKTLLIWATSSDARNAKIFTLTGYKYKSVRLPCIVARNVSSVIENLFTVKWQCEIHII